LGCRGVRSVDVEEAGLNRNGESNEFISQDARKFNDEGIAPLEAVNGQWRNLTTPFTETTMASLCSISDISNIRTMNPSNPQSHKTKQTFLGGSREPWNCCHVTSGTLMPFATHSSCLHNAQHAGFNFQMAVSSLLRHVTLHEVGKGKIRTRDGVSARVGTDFLLFSQVQIVV
jgi:hypothetical protein